MTVFLVLGYRSQELGIFHQQDPKLKVIRYAIRKDLERLCEQGLEWLIFTGNLGFEVWVLEEAKAMQKDYGFSIGTIFPFETHGSQWSAANQLLLEQFRSVDFVKYTFPAYQNPSQFHRYHQFLLDHTDGAYIFYDEEYPTKLSYLVDKMKKLGNYEMLYMTFDSLNDLVSEEDQ